MYVCIFFKMNMYALIISLTLVSVYGFTTTPNNFDPKLNYINHNVFNKNKIIRQDTISLPDYEIPKWVYKKVFKYNKPTTKIKETEYYHVFRNNPKL